MKGFTLIEILLSMALISIIAGMGVPVYQSFQNRNSLDLAVEGFAQSLRRAQALARAVDGDTSWGAYIAPGAITLFQGLSFASRDVGFDELFDISSSISITGLQEVVFLKFSGKPQSIGATILTSPNNETRTITINTEGAIEY
ncbi:MAG: type II secretion system protein [Candidatus Paceibacterota bacterium]